MKCPKCGITNGKTNKFCRDCGTRLDVLTDSQAEAAPQQEATAHDEVALGEELFRVWQLVEAGDLEIALEKGEKVMGENPDSTSSHYLVAHIHERLAERELDAGRTDSGHGFLKLAIAQYERIIDLNPDSSADREKLSLLRAKLAGRDARLQDKVLEPVAMVRARLKKVPPQIAAAAGAFVLILLVVLLLNAGGSRERADAETSEPKRIQVTATQGAPSAPTASQPLSVYTFPTTPRQAPTQVATPPEVRTAASQPETVKPMKLPPVANLTIVPDTKTKPKAETSKPPKPTEASAPVEKPVPASSGSSTLAQSIRLHDQGQTDEAIGAAQQAIALFQIDIQAGRNVEAATRGVENAKKMIALWEQSATYLE